MWSSLRVTFVIVPLVMEHTTPTIRRTACPASHRTVFFIQAIHNVSIVPFAFVPFASQISILHLPDAWQARIEATPDPEMERV
jgi:hypothetical protein